MQISVGMKNLSMAILCMAGKWVATFSLQPSQDDREALFQIHHHLVDHDFILKISFDIFKSVDALVAGVPPIGLTLHHCLANVDGSIHDKVVDNSVQHADIVPGLVLWARWVSGGGAVVGHEVVVDVFSSVLHHPSQLMHLMDAF